MGSETIAPSPDVRLAQVRKVLESRAFHNTEVLKRLLDYLARQALDPASADLKEYTVGVEAFGKPADYDPKTDSSVRVQAGKLRLKLAEYYRTEGTSDTCVIELPKGHFRLEFHEQVEEVAPAPIRKPGFAIWVASATIILLAVSLVVQMRPRPMATPAWSAEMEELWKPFLASPRPVMVVIGTPLFTKVGNAFFRAPALNTWEAATQSEQVSGVAHVLEADATSPAYPYTGVGEAAGAFALQRLLLPHGRDLTLQTSNQLSWEDIARCNMIFLGPPKYNQQTLDLPARQDFEISHARVQNLNPSAGEPKSYDEKWSADRKLLEEGHALISRLPGLHGTGEVLVMAGSSTECTRAAVEFVTRPEYVTPFVRYLRQRGAPPYFQLVVRARFKSGTPIAIELVTLHALR